MALIDSGEYVFVYRIAFRSGRGFDESIIYVVNRGNPKSISDVAEEVEDSFITHSDFVDAVDAHITSIEQIYDMTYELEASDGKDGII